MTEFDICELIRVKQIIKATEYDFHTRLTDLYNRLRWLESICEHKYPDGKDAKMKIGENSYHCQICGALDVRG
jgi:hypothetical protein